MSSVLSWFVIIFTLANIAACWWLASSNSRRRPDDRPEDATMGHVWDGDLQEYNQPLPRWWLYMFYITIVFGVVYLLLFPGLGNFEGVLGWSSEAKYERELQAAEKRYGAIYDRLAQLSIPELAQDDEALAIGHRLYVNNCSVCHGSDARGAASFPNLTDDDWLYGGAPEQIAHSVINGRNGIMPPMGAVLGEDGVDEVVAYVLSLSGGDADAALAAAGEPKFATNCAACHGPDGRGNHLLGAPNLTDDTWLYAGTAEAIRHAIVKGRNNRMPAQKDLLGENRARIVAAYVYSLSRDGDVRGGGR